MNTDEASGQPPPHQSGTPATLHWPAGLDTRQFLDEHWQQKPLLMRQALPGFRSPLSPDELAGLALEEDTTPRLILRDEQGRHHLEHGPFEADRFDSLGTAGWSLLVTDVEKHLPELAVWLAPFRFLPAWRLDDLMISYAPDGASVGAHVDEYDVFLLQASGRRRWEIRSDTESTVPGTAKAQQDTPPAGPEAGDNAASTDGADAPARPVSLTPETDTGELRLLHDFVPDQSWVLEPGDLLYLPPGVAHHGIAVGDDCMTWSIGFRAPAQRDVVEEFSAMLADSLNHQRFTDPALDPLQAADAAEISTATILRFAELWADAVRLEPAQFRDFVGRLVTASASPPDLSMSEHGDLPVPAVPGRAAPAHGTALNGSADAGPAPTVVWARHPFSRFAFARAGHDEALDQARLFVDGEAYDCSTSFARRLCNPGNAELPPDLASDPAESELLDELARRGKIEPLVD